MTKPTQTYLVLRDIVANRIREGKYAEYAKLPSERELAEDLQTTRLTLRDALLQLEMEGLVFRMDRRGWFVAGARLSFDPTEDKGFMTNVSLHGHEPQTELLHCEIEKAPGSIARALKIAPGADIYHLQRKRSINNRPVLIEDIFLNASRYPGLHHVNLEGSLSLVLSDIYGAKVKYSDIQITPVAFNTMHAKLLHISPGTPATMITRTSYDSANAIMEYDQEYWLSDVLRIELRTQKRK